MSEDTSKRKTEYEKMSISRLEELLREDALCDTCPDPRELLLIASVLEAKRRELEPESLPEPSAELAAFREHYEPMAADREIHICAEEKSPRSAVRSGLSRSRRQRSRCFWRAA